MSAQDLRQKKLLEAFPHLRSEGKKVILQVATTYNTLGRIKDAMNEDNLSTPSFIPEFFEDKNYIEALQWLVFCAVRGYVSEHRQPAPLQDIRNRVFEKVRAMQKEGSWKEGWKFPGRDTIDRRINEIASPNQKENHIMKNGVARALGLGNGLYVPNPVLYEDVAKILEGTKHGL